MPRLLAALLLSCALAVPGRACAAEELLVFAASSLTNVLHALAPAFEKTTNDRITFSFGGSSDLARQIVAGAPADVFFSADLAQAERLVAAGALATEDLRELLSNTLVVVATRVGGGAPRAPPPTLAGAADVARVRKLALADPKVVPAGVYAKEWLEKTGAWKAAEPHVLPTTDVRAALAAVATGAADAAVVYATDASVEPRVRVAWAVPAADGPRIRYVVAPVKTSEKRADAQKLVDFLASPAARPVFERAGFGVLP
jgi:molybdate transport system substrate-binding protein